MQSWKGISRLTWTVVRWSAICSCSPASSPVQVDSITGKPIPPSQSSKLLTEAHCPRAQNLKSIQALDSWFSHCSLSSCSPASPPSSAQSSGFYISRLGGGHPPAYSHRSFSSRHTSACTSPQISVQLTYVRCVYSRLDEAFIYKGFNFYIIFLYYKL